LLSFSAPAVSLGEGWLRRTPERWVDLEAPVTGSKAPSRRSDDAAEPGAPGAHGGLRGIPVSPGTFVPRQRLDVELDHALSKPLTVLVAPAGSGKTAAVARSSRSTGWSPSAGRRRWSSVTRSWQQGASTCPDREGSRAAPAMSPVGSGTELPTPEWS
jgi:hypothetical protein